MTASWFSRNAARISRPDPRRALASSVPGGRPAPSRLASSGPPAPAAPASSVAIADPRVGDSVGDVGSQVPEHRGHADGEGGAEQDREVVAGGGLVEKQAHPRGVE